MHCYSVLSPLFSSKDFTSTVRKRQDGVSEGGRERRKKITVAKRGFSTSSPTKSHHFRRLTSVCDKCSTSSSLPISLELETPEASAACKIKNDHLIHSSTKYISGERRKSGQKGREGERERKRGSVSPVHHRTPPSRILLDQLLLNEVLIQTDLCVAKQVVALWLSVEFLLFLLSRRIYRIVRLPPLPIVHLAWQLCSNAVDCWRCPLQIAAATKPFKWSC